MFFTSFFLNGLIPYSTTENFTTAKSDLGTLLFMGFFAILLGFLYSYGAAKLSYNYNIYLGNSQGAAFMNSILAFIFSNFYYPLYALVLSPIGV